MVKEGHSVGGGGGYSKKLWFSKIIHVSRTFNFFALSPHMNKELNVYVQKKPYNTEVHQFVWGHDALEEYRLLPDDRENVKLKPNLQ